jgi:hypothetical protein
MSPTTHPILDAIAAIDLPEPRDKLLYRKAADIFKVDRTTLSWRHQNKACTNAEAHKEQMLFNPQQEKELVRYIQGLSDRGLAPTRSMIKGSLLKEYQLLQNQALGQILGAFKGFPIKAMEIEAAILPVSLRAEKLCHQYAIRTLSFAKSHPIRKAIKRQQQLGISTQLGELARRVQGLHNVEEITILLAKPWSKPAFKLCYIYYCNKQQIGNFRAPQAMASGSKRQAKGTYSAIY